MFQFKQFAVDQAGCAMKINTDGVLIGALAWGDDPKRILDIGTGTGVIAMMLAQRFPSAQIDAVEIDAQAAQTAGRNFSSSQFSNRLNAYAQSFERFFDEHHENKYDLIVSNPPFYINSLKSPGAGRAMAKHADADFFEKLIGLSALHLTPMGSLWLVLPIETAALVGDLAAGHGLNPQNKVSIKSYPQSEPHREMVGFSKEKADLQSTVLTIYNSPNQYTAQYREALRDFFTIF